MKNSILSLAALLSLPLAAEFIPLPVQKEKVPADVRENPYVEKAFLLTPDKQETSRQFVLFSRPLTDPIWAETRPQAYERVGELTGWGARKQFVSLNFALYPLSELKDLSIEIESNSVKPEVRVVRYWKIIYPFYHSFSSNPKDKQYRRMPEFLAACNGMASVTANEPQRFVLTFELPADGTEKLEGNVVIKHAGMKEAVRLPYSVKILPFELKRDPKKHYFAYHWSLIGEKDDFFVRNRGNKKLVYEKLVEEYKRMREYGFTRPPHMRLTFSKDRFYIPDYDIHIPALKEAGFDINQGILLTGASVHYFFKKHTGKDLGKHSDNVVDNLPEAIFTDIEDALDKFLAHAKENDYPPFFYNPIDEPDPNARMLVKRVYEIFKKRGLTTMLTSPPESYKQISDVIDIYNYGKFYVPYKAVIADKDKEYWCYPNDNAYQIKDPNVMCHGGRMTYGLGFWKSGFTSILPYLWREGRPNRICYAGGNLTWEDGTLLMTMYWECFRQGEDDLRYIYTLQDDIVKREGSKVPGAQKILADAKALLQRIWNATCPQGAYLRENLLPHAELNAYRALVANEIMKVRQIPECNSNAAPSVIVDPDGKWVNPGVMPQSDNVMTLPLTKWRSLDKEGTISNQQGNSLTYTVKVDHNAGSGSHSKYPVGWPRLYTDFGMGRPGVDLSKYNHLEFDLTVSSDRDVESDYRWPIAMELRNYDWNTSGNFRISHVLEPDVKHRMIIPLNGILPQPKRGFRNAAHMQFYINEANYPHGATLKMKFENIRFVGYKSPTVNKVSIPAVVELPCNGFSIPVELVGYKGKACTFTGELRDADGKIADTVSGKVKDGFAACGFSGKNLKKGVYKSILKIVCDGKVVSEVSGNIEVIDGPGAK